jgi:hypothetical protein
MAAASTACVVLVGPASGAARTRPRRGGAARGRERVLEVPVNHRRNSAALVSGRVPDASCWLVERPEQPDFDRSATRQNGGSGHLVLASYAPDARFARPRRRRVHSSSPASSPRRRGRRSPRHRARSWRAPVWSRSPAHGSSSRPRAAMVCCGGVPAPIRGDGRPACTEPSRRPWGRSPRSTFACPVTKRMRCRPSCGSSSAGGTPERNWSSSPRTGCSPTTTWHCSPHVRWAPCFRGQAAEKTITSLLVLTAVEVPSSHALGRLSILL